MVKRGEGAVTVSYPKKDGGFHVSQRSLPGSARVAKQSMLSLSLNPTSPNFFFTFSVV